MDEIYVNMKPVDSKPSTDQTDRDSVHGLSEELSALKANLTEERNLLNASLTEMSKKLQRLQSLSAQNKTCPTGWRMFSSTCYFISITSDSWEKGRQDCRDRGGDLVVIDSSEEQEFLSKIANQNTWIGLSDREKEGTWKWTDGTPLTLTFLEIRRFLEIRNLDLWLVTE
ncbi:hypothetical protein PAMA_002911 [Pampus argenteus]